MPNIAAYTLLIDWQDNDWASPYSDVTSRVLDQRTPVTIRYGRDQARQLSPVAGGELNCELDNRSHDYSPENTASPLAGYVTSGRKVSFKATTSSTETVLYSGYIDDFDIKPGLNDQSVPVSCIDALSRLKGQTVSTPLYQGIRTGDAVNYLLDAVGFPSDKRDIDSGASYLPYWWLDDADAYDAMMAIVDSEGPAALVTVGADRSFVFRDRHHRLTRSASLTSQATWRSSALEPVMSDPLTYNHGWKEIVNSVSVEVPQRTRGTEAADVWTSEGLLSVPAGTTATVIARSSDPFLGAITPVQDTDYTLLSGSVTITINRTSGQSTVISIAAAAGTDAVLQALKLRAIPITSTSVTVTVEDSTSIAKYGRKAYGSGSRLPVWCNTYDATAILNLIIAQRAERLPTLQVTMRGAGNRLRLAQCLHRNLSDRVHITESLTGLDADFFIEQISHTIGAGGADHVTTFGLEKIPPTVTNPFTFDVSGKGFDQGLFGGGVPDDPNTMFRFDTAGHGFDQGLFVN
jgi:hypothetical protein